MILRSLIYLSLAFHLKLALSLGSPSNGLYANTTIITVLLANKTASYSSSSNLNYLFSTMELPSISPMNSSSLEHNSSTTVSSNSSKSRKNLKSLIINWVGDDVENLHRNETVYCKFQPNGFDCDESGIFTPKFYFDVKLEDCRAFYYGQCPFSRNKFNTLNDCHQTCHDVGMRDIAGNFSSEIYCNFQPDFGSCNDYFPKWYFDVTTRTCKGFSYSGCGGNLNRFETNQQCLSVCSINDDE